MKQEELQKCVFCEHGMAHAGDLAFIRVKLDYMMLDQNAIRRQAGLEMLVGNPVIANVMGPDENLAVEVSSKTVLVCFQCAVRPQPLLMILQEDDDDK